MTGKTFSLLLCTNGNPATRPALEYGVWLAKVLQAPVLLLGVIEAVSQQKLVENLVAETEQRLAEAGVATQTRFERGRGSVVMAEVAHSGEYLAVVGPLGRPAWRRVVQGRSFRRLLEKIESPILYVPKARLPLKRLLLCLGGLGYATGVEQVALYLAQATGARITLLHIVEPVTLDYPVSRQIQHQWKTIQETDTPQGRNLRNALEDIRRSGLEADFIVRHGNIVHEILEEVSSGEYDLVGMGSPHSTHSLRHLYMPNVTAEVAESLDLPVLTVRQGHELIP